MTVAVPEVERPLDLNRRGTSSWRALEPHILPALIVALAAVLRFHGLGQQSVWFDEAASAHVAQTPWRDFLVTLRQSEITPPLYYVLLKGWMFFFGTSEFSIRAPSAIFGIVSVWLMYDLARRILGRTEGLIAAFLLCISKFHIEYSHEARSYALLMMLALWSCIEFLRLFQQPTRRSEVRYWIATILMLYAHLYGVFVVAAQNIGYLALLAPRLRGRPLPSYRPQQWFSLQMVLALGYTPCLILINYWAQTRTHGFWIRPFTLDHISETYAWFCGGVAPLLIVVVFAAIGSVRRSVRPHLAMLWTMLLLPVILPIVVSQFTLPMFTPRYAIAAIIPIFILAAAGIAAIPSRVFQACVLLLICVSSFHAPEYQHKDDWRSAGAYLTMHLHSGDQALMTDAMCTFVYDYYVNRPDVRRRGLYYTALPFDIPLPNDRHAWVILNTPRLHIRDIINRGNWRVVSQKCFDGIIVLELDDGVTDPRHALPPEQRFAAKRG